MPDWFSSGFRAFCTCPRHADGFRHVSAAETSSFVLIYTEVLSIFKEKPTFTFEQFIYLSFNLFLRHCFMFYYVSLTGLEIAV